MLDYHAYTALEGDRWTRDEERERRGRYEPIVKGEDQIVSDKPKLCPECHHRPSMRSGDPAYCYCECHDVADAAPVLLAFAQAHAKWEANLVLSNEAWRGGMAEFPTLTQELFDEFLEVQRLRNAAVKKATEAIA